MEPPLMIISMVEHKTLAMLPCCEKLGVIWGRSVQGHEWAECETCGKTWPGYMAGQHQQSVLYAKIDKRNEHNAATAA